MANSSTFKALIFSLATASSAVSAAPVALVEEIDSFSTGVAYLDFVQAGDVIKLGKDGTMILSYLNSCIEEQIVGGTVTVGKTQSEINNGKVRRSSSECDSGQLVLAADEASKSGAIAFRNAFDSTPKDSTSRITVFHTSPVFLLPQSQKLTVTRLDSKGETHQINDVGNEKGRVMVDLQKLNIKLTAGGQYQVSNGERSIIFNISKDAFSSKSPALSRLVPM